MGCLRGPLFFARSILQGDVTDGAVISVDVQAGRLHFERQSPVVAAERGELKLC